MVSDLFDIAFPKNNIEVKSKHLNTPWIAKGFRKSSEHLYEKFLKKRTIKNEKTYKKNLNYSRKLKSILRKNIEIK